MKRGVGWSLVAAAVGLLGSLLVTPVVLHTLGAAEYGVYLLVTSLASYAGFFDLGLTWSATRYFARDIASANQARLSSRFQSLSRLLLALGVLSAALGIAVGPHLMRVAGAEPGRIFIPAIALAVASFVLSLQGQLHSSLLRAGSHFAEAARPIAIGSFLAPLASYLALQFNGRLLSLLAVNAGVNALVLFTYVSHSNARLPRRRPEAPWDSGCISEMLSFGGWTTLSRLLILFMTQVDRLVVALLRSVTDLTYYAVPANLAARIAVLAGPAATNFFARASLLHAEGDIQQLRLQSNQATRLLTWAVLAIVVPIMLIGPDFLRVWIGAEMAARGSLALQLLAAGHGVSAATSINTVVLEACGRARLVATVRLCWTLLAAGTALSLAPRYGSLAIAISLAIWLAGVGLTNCAFCWRVLPATAQSPWTSSSAPRIAVAVGVTFLVVPVLTPSVTDLTSALAALFLGAVLTLAVAYAAVLTNRDRRYVLSTLHQHFLATPLLLDILRRSLGSGDKCN